MSSGMGSRLKKTTGVFLALALSMMEAAAVRSTGLMAMAAIFLARNWSTWSFWVGWAFWLSTISTVALPLALSMMALRTYDMKVSSNL